MVMVRNLDSLENYDNMWDDTWITPKEERDNNGKVTSTERLATESD
jgi:hypothetical protein